MELTWSTEGLAPEDQFAYWADVVCEACAPLAPVRTRQHLSRSRWGEGLTGWVRAERLADSTPTEVVSCTQRLTHGPAEVRRGRDEQIFVNLQLDGTGRGEQDGRRCVVPPGSFAVFDTTRPYVLEFDESPDGSPWRVLSFKIPREQMLPFIPQPALRTARTIDARSGAGAVAADMMTSLWRSRAQLSPASRLALDHACTEVIANALGAFEKDGDDRSSVDDALRASIARFVHERLPHGQVLAVEAARHVGISVRKLHQLYNGHETTFGATVRDLRLQRAARQLEMQGPHVTVTDVATRWGFCDASHLNRAFKARYGMSPTAYRESSSATVT
ncbi:helix-turn-helix domain-containing protein [Blastococcus sp. SYSU D00669]